MISRLLILLCLVATSAYGKRLHPESWYQKIWCEGKGKTEVVQADRTRVDCLTNTHAIEFDFGNKWSEAIGQSLGYSLMTNKRAGIVLIIESDKEYKYWIKLNSIIDHFKLPIDTWIMRPTDVSGKHVK